MKKMFAVLVVIFWGLAGSAHAALIDATLGNTGSSVTYGTGGTLNPNINLASLGGSLTLNNATIITPPSTLIGSYIQPSGSLYGNNYVAVFGSASVTGSATLSLAAGHDVFGFTWGTIDAYNTLTLTDSRNVTYIITGSQILARIAGSVAGTTQTNIKFFDPYGSIVSAQLSSTQNAFEAGNFSVSSVPLPASLPLFAMAMAGLFVVAQRRSREPM